MRWDVIRIVIMSFRFFFFFLITTGKSLDLGEWTAKEKSAREARRYYSSPAEEEWWVVQVYE